MILWDVMFRSQQGVAISFLEDVWTRNLLNVFVAPVRPAEYLSAAFCVGFVRIGVTVIILGVLSWALFAFNILGFGWGLILFFANLLLFGWSLGVFSTALIMRYGQAAESFAWAVPFMVQPITAVYYPVSVMPGWLQWVALGLPSTHVFEGMRAVMDGPDAGFSWPHFAWALRTQSRVPGSRGPFLCAHARDRARERLARPRWRRIELPHKYAVLGTLESAAQGREHPFHVATQECGGIEPHTNQPANWLCGSPCFVARTGEGI